METPHTCRGCGQPLAANAPEGLCPRCLMAGALHPTEATPWAVPELEIVRSAFPNLEIIALIGAGGMGAVYQARQPQLDRFVALKILPPERTDEARFAERFQREAQALARLNHPHIVTVHDFGRANGFFYLLMEYVDGVSLRQAMKAGRFTPEQALAVVPQVCEALQFAHEHGVVHRDIKPENLLMDKGGRVKIADFGIAKLLGVEATNDEFTESQPAGTPQYMAPEQKAHARTDHRADIYSLGVVLYELLTGELPGRKLQPPSQRASAVQIDVRLDEIVLRALQASPELRYQTAADFRTHLQTVAQPQAAPVPAPKRSALRGVLRILLIVVTVLFTLIVVGIFIPYFARMRVARQSATLSQPRITEPLTPDGPGIVLNLQSCEIDGEWRVVSRRFHGQDQPPAYANEHLVFKNQRMMRKDDLLFALATFQVNPGYSPKQIDFAYDEPRENEHRHMAIYRLEGERLIIACDKARPHRRPAGFVSLPENGIELLTLERVTSLFNFNF